MLKLRKKLSIIIITLLSVFNLPMIAAQNNLSVATAWQEISQKAIDQDFQSFHMSGNVGVKISSQNMTSDLGSMEIDMQVSDQPIALQLIANIISPFFGSEPAGFEVYAKDGFNYIYNTQLGSWEISEWLASEEEIRSDLQKSIDQASNNLVSDELTEEAEKFINTYFDLEENQDTYLFKLKEKIDGEAFYHDLDAAVDLDQAIEETADKATEQAEELGQEPEANYEESLNQVLTPESFVRFFEMNPQMNATYDRQTGLIRKLILMIDLDPQFIAEQTSEVDFSSLPESVKIEVDLSFDQYGESLNIQVPPEAVQGIEPTTSEE